ncbi:hypothetical protein G1H11_09375 [Phytoactinopolyspora alkaliphila]|uniref:Actinobacteria/chloroflexi VLRF1 release factor domain-containing protein n=1 Tax=Phytoactinopolyspora alkaliphila TaxID=1783498 RepID=A0A6N9YKJ9_9ACTN|nr:acVLRF1 family peptidyl-tRNA hydrolase [Phytoactinopolyspora alkaliphila]NED95523.1 hypothetical protein [Phytoactinopolyspora alkaliphila]
MPTKHVSITPERLEHWLEGFAERHGASSTHAEAEHVVVRAADGSEARCSVPFGPLRIDPESAYLGLLDHARRDRLVGVILVRRGGYAAGVFEGRVLVASKVGSRHVQGRTAAGGQSQQRFSRRRDNQAREAFAAAADVAARVLVPYTHTLEAVVCGGDRRAVSQVLSDPRLAGLLPMVVPPHLAVPDPKLRVLRDTADMFRAVEIEVIESTPQDAPRNKQA